MGVTESDTTYWLHTPHLFRSFAEDLNCRKEIHQELTCTWKYIISHQENVKLQCNTTTHWNGNCKKVLGSPMVRIPSFHWRTHVQSLLWDLRSHKLHGTAEKKFLQCSGSGPQWGNCVKNHLISWFQLSRGWDFVIYWDAALSDFSCRISNS